MNITKAKLNTSITTLKEQYSTKQISREYVRSLLDSEVITLAEYINITTNYAATESQVAAPGTTP